MTAFVGALLSEKWTPAQLTNLDSGPVPGIGDIYVSHDNKTYRFVQYRVGAGGIGGQVGSVVGFFAPGGVSTGLSNVVTADVSETAGLGAGVLMAAAADGDFCWIQVKGAAQIAPALVSGASGQPLTLSTTADGTLKVAGAATDAVVAFAVNAGTRQIMCAFPH